MTDHPELDFEAARARGELGLERATERAERNSPSWVDSAYAAVCAVLPTMHGEFTFEALRVKAEGYVDPPTDKRAWGAVTRRCTKAGILEETGGSAPRASGNCTPAKLYRRPGVDQILPPVDPRAEARYYRDLLVTVAAQLDNRRHSAQGRDPLAVYIEEKLS